MAMTAYEKGRAAEYRNRNKLKEQGYTVIRAAGSHSPWDLIAIKDEDGHKEIRLIQLKFWPKKDNSQKIKDLGSFNVTDEFWVV